MSYVVTGIPPIIVPLIWNQAKDFLQDAIDEANNETNLDLVLADAISGDGMIVLIYSGFDVVGAANLRKQVFETGKAALFVNLLGGTKMNEWIEEAHNVAVQIAKAKDCSEIYCVGRAGWEKVLKNTGYTKAYTLMSFSLEG